MEYTKPCSREGCDNLIRVRWKYILNTQKYCSLHCLHLSKIGKKHSEETIQKMKHKHNSENHVAWNRGLTKETDNRVKKCAERAKEAKRYKTYTSWSKGLTKETDSRIRKVAKMKEGKKVSDETKRKISETLKGRIIPRDIVEKISNTHKNNFRIGIISPWNKGLTKENNESLLKMAQEKEGKKLSEEHKKKIGEKSKGRKKSDISKQKHSEKRIEYLESHKQMFKWFNTKPELCAKQIFEKMNIEYIHQKKVKNYLFDFYLPKFNFLIEVDGVYHHGKVKSKKTGEYDELQLKIMKRDKLKDQIALEEGYNLKRVWSDEIDSLENWLTDLI